MYNLYILLHKSGNKMKYTAYIMYTIHGTMSFAFTVELPVYIIRPYI